MKKNNFTENDMKLVELLVSRVNEINIQPVILNETGDGCEIMGGTITVSLKKGDVMVRDISPFSDPLDFKTNTEWLYPAEFFMNILREEGVDYDYDKLFNLGLEGAKRLENIYTYEPIKMR